MLSDKFISASITMSVLILIMAAIWNIGKLFKNNLNCMYMFLLVVSLIFMLITFPMGVFESKTTGKNLNIYTLYLMVTLGFLSLGLFGVAMQKISRKVSRYTGDTELLLSMCMIFIPIGGFLCIYKFITQYWLIR